MFESLSERLDGAIKNLKGQGRITDLNIAATIKEIRRALVDADVNYKIAKEFTDRVKEKTLGEKVLTAVSPGQLMVKIVQDELTGLMGGTKSEFNLKGNPAVILLSGLQGSGKTTFAAKLANYLKTKRNRLPLLVACDVYRPAAIEQLKILGEQIGVTVYAEEGNNNPLQIAENGIRQAKLKEFDTVIVDTAGRLAVDEEMMNEIAKLRKVLQPQEVLFVVDAMTGQDAVNTSKLFNERLDFDGVVLTKLDGDSRGGAALSIKYEVNKPIKFVSTGEKLDQIFHGIASVKFVTDGSGPNVSLRITKNDGVPVTIVPEGTPGSSVVAVRRVDELGFYNLGRDDLATKVGLTTNKTSAAIRVLGLKADADCYKEFKIGAVRHQRYSQEAIARVRGLLAVKSPDEVWQEYRKLLAKT